MNVARMANTIVGLLLVTVPAHSKESKPKAGSVAHAGVVDHHFGCVLEPASKQTLTLKSWGGGGIGDLPASTKAKFRELGVLRSESDLTKFKKTCTKLPASLKFFVSAPAGGNMSSATLVVAQEDMQVYRAYSSPQLRCGVDRPSNEFGGWWSLVPLPAATARESYRTKMAVCHSYNDMTKKVTCTLKKGSVIAVGPTQSIDCLDNQLKKSAPGCATVIAKWPGKYPASGNHQVYLNLFKREAEKDSFLTNCHSEDWK